MFFLLCIFVVDLFVFVWFFIMYFCCGSVCFFFIMYFCCGSVFVFFVFYICINACICIFVFAPVQHN